MTTTYIESSSPRCETLLRRENHGCSAKILIVDDEPINIKVAQRYLRQAGYEDFVTTTDSREALDIIRREQPDVIVLDIMMPHVSGLNILEVVRGDRRLHHLPVLILTAACDDETKEHALELGATDFLTKPVKPTELAPRVRNALVVKKHHDHMAEYSTRLEEEVRQRTAELAESRQELIHVLACAAEYRDQETGNHVIRVGRYSGIIARHLGLEPHRCELIEQAAWLHDVGKIGIPDAILLKKGRLENVEMDTMREHCEYGLNILRGIPQNHQFLSYSSKTIKVKSPILLTAATIAVSHHERWDGSGYPLGLSGEQIPIEGRIVAVADVFDALSSVRPYKPALPLDQCMDMVQNDSGTHFDPKVVEAFFRGDAEVIETFTRYAD